MKDVNGVELAIFLFFFLLVTVMGFLAARWRRADSTGQPRRVGPGRPRLRHVHLVVPDRRRHLHRLHVHRGAGDAVRRVSVVGFFAVPYTIVLYPIIFIFLPRLWSVSHRHGYVTPADFVRGRFDSKPLALAVAVTGILATMPYIALQLVGIQVVLEVMGIGGGRESPGSRRTLPLFIAFAVLAAYTYSSGLRAPALIAFVKDGLIYVVIIVAVFYLPSQLGGWDNIFASAKDSFTAFNTENADAIAAGDGAGQGHHAAAGRALGLRVAGPRLGAGAVHVPALAHRRARLEEPLGDPAQRRAAAGVLLPARPARAARLRRHRRRASRSTTRSSRCRRCSSRSSRAGSPASRSRPSRSAPSCPPRSCRSPRRTSGPATSTRRSSTPTATPQAGGPAEQADLPGREVRRAGRSCSAWPPSRRSTSSCSAACGSCRRCRR